VPCGITDKSVTSLERELGRKVDMEEVKNILLKEFAIVFESEIFINLRNNTD
jgi:lipoyl(octanoyl) transferase